MSWLIGFALGAVARPYLGIAWAALRGIGEAAHPNGDNDE